MCELKVDMMAAGAAYVRKRGVDARGTGPRMISSQIGSGTS